MFVHLKRGAIAGAAVVLCALSGETHAQPGYYHTDLGTLGGNQSHAMDVNQFGVVVGWSTIPGGQRRAFRWVNGQMQDLGVLPGQTSSEALGINIRGEIVGISGSKAFYWDDGVMTEIPNTLGGVAIQAHDISDAGRVCGWAYEPNFTKASFWWEPAWGNPVFISEPPGTTSSEARAINFYRETACFSEADGRAWRAYYTNYQFISGPTNPEATDINDAGSMVGGTGTFPTSAWLWKDTTGLQTIPNPPGRNDAYAHGMNRDHIVVGDSWDAPFYSDLDAWVYYNDTNTTHWLQDLDNSSWEFEVAEAINAYGQIVGAGTIFGSGPPRAFLLTPVPEKGFLLVPNSNTKLAHVLDPRYGTPLGVISLAFTSTPIEIIDGNGGDLLVSDQTADTIWRLTSSGALAGEFVDEPVDDVRGIAKSLGGYIVGASAGGFRAWRSDGTEVATGLDENTNDVELLNYPAVKRYLMSSVQEDNLQSYDLDVVFRGETAPGGASFPHQVELMTSNRIATAAYGTGEIVIYRLVSGAPYRRFPVQGLPRGLYQNSENGLIVSTGRGVFSYTDSGFIIDTLLSGEGFQYISQCRNFRP